MFSRLYYHMYLIKLNLNLSGNKDINNFGKVSLNTTGFKKYSREVVPLLVEILGLYNFLRLLILLFRLL